MATRNLLDVIRQKPERDISTIDDYLQAINQFVYNGHQYTTGLNTTLNVGNQEIVADHGAFLQAFSTESVLFACIATRQLVFSEARFQWRRFEAGRPGDLFGEQSLRILEEPWANGTTGELLARMEQDASLCGNFFAVRSGNELHRLRPDRVTIIRAGDTEIDAHVIGYGYTPVPGEDTTILPVGDVVHYSPYPDPVTPFRGMSWVTPVVRELSSHRAATAHKRKFFENGATPSLVVSLDAAVNPTEFEDFIDKMDASHKGVANAYKTMYLGGGADATVVGSNFEQMNFTSVQGASETLIAAASGVPPVVIGFSEGLQAAPQPLDAKVLTPRGWTTMGDLERGDSVIGRDGKGHDVVGVYPRVEPEEVYRVTFTDGTATECTADHLWNVKTPRDRDNDLPYRSCTLAEIMERGVRTARGRSRWSIPMIDDPVQFDEQEPLPVHPYLLGALLGDGGFLNGTLSFATSDQQMLDELTPLLPAGVKFVSTGQPYGYRIVRSGDGYRNPLISQLRDLGLWDVPGRNKSIPDAYMTGDVLDRVALLQGLLDTDGNVCKPPCSGARMSSTSETLVRQTAELAASLGARADVRPEGRERNANQNPQWVVKVTRLPEWIVPVRLERKRRDWQPTTTLDRSRRVRFIAEVTPVGRKPVQCIRVDVQDSLYVTDNYVLTHNTYSNYAQARRRFVDGTLRPLWRIAAASLQKILPDQSGAQLWYDDRDIPFLREDMKDEAEIEQIKAATIRQLIDGGYEPSSVVAAVTAGDMNKLSHTGLTSVQLLPPGVTGEPAPDPDRSLDVVIHDAFVQQVRSE